MATPTDAAQIRDTLRKSLRATLRPFGQAVLDALRQPDVETLIETLAEAGAAVIDSAKQFAATSGSEESALALETALRVYRAAMAAVRERTGEIVLGCVGTGPAH